MKTMMITVWWLTGMICSLTCAAQTVYRCETDQGIEFSDEPCGDNAEAIEIEIKQPAGAGDETFGPEMDAELFKQVATKSPEEVISIVGGPAATYVDDGIISWLYPNGCRTAPDEACPEILFERNAAIEINWLPRDIMDKSVRIAQGFADFSPPPTVREKSFTLADIEIDGLGKSEVVAALGQPDVKKVFEGVEYWEYKRVPRAAGDSYSVVVYVEFDGDEVVRIATNEPAGE